jgi:2-polyprenyl-3-methyl-5-hydroxy-6-metoxy-1,4-benzoquinol methylase
MTCQLCGASAFDPLLDVPEANFSSRITHFRILRCRNCELATMDPFPTQRDIEELYVQQGVFSTRAPNPYVNRLAFRFLEPLYQRYGTDLRFIAKQCLARVPTRRPAVLDVGSSTGRLLNAFKLAAPELEVTDLTGIDIDPNAKAKAISYLRDRIVIGDFLQHRFERQFNVVTMRFVIEHLLDFRSYILRAVELLAPGGVLFLSTPDMDSRQARQLGERWQLVNDPRQKIGHLRWFNRKSLHFLAAEFGLRIERCLNRGEFLYHLPAFAQRVLRSVLGTDAVSGRFIRYYPLRILNATFLDGVLAQTFSYGDGLYAFLKKG